MPSKYALITLNLAYLDPRMVFNPLSVKLTNDQTHSKNLSAFADELFECV